MSNRIDKLFRDKFEDHSLPPRIEAWSKIESGLAKKNKKIAWLKVAAVVTLVAISSIVWLSLLDGTETDTPAIATNTTSSTEEKSNPSVEPSPKDELAVQQKIEKDSVKKKNKVYKTTKSNKQTKQKSTIESIRPSQFISTESVAKIETDATLEEQSASALQEEEILTVAEVAPKKKAVVIVYTLTYEEPVTVAKVEEDKKSGFKKVIEFAQDAREGEKPIVSLRQVKNDILALNFRKDKDQKNYKQN